MKTQTQFSRGNVVASILAIVAVIAIIIVIVITNQNRTTEDMTVEEAVDMMHEAESMMEKGEALMGKAEEMVESVAYTGEVLAGETTPLLAFNQMDFEKAQTEGKRIMLYFYANWCPNCKTELAEALIPAFNELEEPDVVGFIVNYNDTRTDKYEKDLAREYGIGYQHSRVFLDETGSLLEKTAPVTWTKEQYIEYFSNLAL